MGPQGADEKAKDLKGTLKKLLHYMSVFKVQMLLIVIFAVCGTTFLEKQQRKLPTV
jgi:ATP-binding cassette subfamily B protein